MAKKKFMGIGSSGVVVSHSPGGKRNMMRNILKQKVRSRMQKAPAFPRPTSGTEGIHSANADLDIAAPLPPEVKKR